MTEEKYVEMEFIEETNREDFDYSIRDLIYKCPCGKGRVVYSKERPNGLGQGIQSTFSDILVSCDDCKKDYDFNLIYKGRAYIK